MDTYNFLKVIRDVYRNLFKQLRYTYGMNAVKSVRQYVGVSLPKELVSEIESVIKNKKLGYTTVAEFVKDAVRRRLEEIEKMQKTRNYEDGSFIDADSDVEVF